MTSEVALDEMGERRLVSEILGPRYRSNPTFGDDCAVVPLAGIEGVELVATTDPCPTPLVASLGWDDPYYMGWLLATINLSDLAAAGAEPIGLMVSYVLPGKLGVAKFEQMVNGVDECCRAHGTAVLGGNIGDGPAVHLTGTAIGRCEPGTRLGRRGARPGDALLLCGGPGYLWATALLRLGHASLPADDAEAVFERALRPRAQLPLGRGLAVSGLARAAIDVSDGLYASVLSLCESNGLGAAVDVDVALDPLVADVCRQAQVDPFELAQLWGDWLLLVAVDPARVDEVHDLAAGVGSSAREIGVLTPSPEIVLRGSDRTEPWIGVASERFTRSSWSSDLVGAYMERLRRAPTQPSH